MRSSKGILRRLVILLAGSLAAFVLGAVGVALLVPATALAASALLVSRVALGVRSLLFLAHEQPPTPVAHANGRANAGRR